MVSSFRLRAKRTTGSEPPEDILFGELAYSDGDQQFYIGRPTGPPATFISDLTPITDDIDSLTTTASGHAAEIAALATTTSGHAAEIAALEMSDQAQDSAIAVLATTTSGHAAEIAALEMSDQAQDSAIAVLATTTSGHAAEIAALEMSDQAQDSAIAVLATTTNTQASALTVLAVNTQDSLNLKLEAADIAAFETNTQLDTRDTGNRDRANHTGDQSASTITGLAVVATSGGYADLLNKPIIPSGFTYDQQSEPLSPAVGATWRERSGSGLIIGNWEWSGSLWLNVEEFSASIASGSDASAFNGISATAGRITQLPFERCLAVRAITGITTNAPTDSTNRWDISLGFCTQQNGANSITVGSWSLTTNVTRQQRIQNLSGLNVAGDTVIRCVAQKINSPGSLTMGVTVILRKVRN